MKSKARKYNSTIINDMISNRNPIEYKNTKRSMLLADKIANAIESKGWTRKQFAVSINKNPSEVTKWLSGTHNFTLATLYMLESHLDLTLFEISEKVGSV